MSRLDGSLALPKGARENGWEGAKPTPINLSSYEKLSRQSLMRLNGSMIG